MVSARSSNLRALCFALTLASVAGCGNLSGSSETGVYDIKSYEGCTKAESGGPYAIEVFFTVPNGATSVIVLRNGTSVYESSPQSQGSYVDSALVPGETYVYTCVATVGGRRYEGAVSPSLTLEDPLKGYVGCTAAAVEGSGSVLLTYQFPAGATKAIVARNGSEIFSTTDPNETTYLNQDLDLGRVYEYTCKIEIGDNIVVGSLKQAVAIADPLAGTLLGCKTAAALNSSKVQIEYQFPDGADSVTLRRDTEEIAKIETGGDGFFVDEGLTPGTAYKYTCSAQAGERTRDGINTPTVTTRALPQLSYSGSSGKTGLVNLSMSVTPTVISGSGGTVTSCSLKQGTLPAGLALNDTTCRISGMPTALSPSTDYVVVLANSVGDKVEATVTLKVDANVPDLDYTGAGGRTGSVGVAMLVSPTTLHANGSAVTACTLRSDEVTVFADTGLTLSAACVVTGTPVQALAETTFHVVATNAVGTSQEAPVTLSVTP